MPNPPPPPEPRPFSRPAAQKAKLSGCPNRSATRSISCSSMVSPTPRSVERARCALSDLPNSTVVRRDEGLELCGGGPCDVVRELAAVIVADIVFHAKLSPSHAQLARLLYGPLAGPVVTANAIARHNSPGAVLPSLAV